MAAFLASDAGIAHDRELILRAAVSAYLGRYGGQTRLHTASDLGIFLCWCTDQDLDPLGAVRVDIEQVRALAARRAPLPALDGLPPTVGGGRLLPDLRD
jgi:hypothetical protein